MGDFFEYLYREEKLSLGTIKYIQKKYGEELSDTAIERILRLLELAKELGLDVKYLNQNYYVFDIIDVYDDDDFDAALEYISEYAKKRKKKKHNPYVLLALMVAANDIIKNNMQDDAEKIAELLEREGLVSILQNKSGKNKEILYKVSYSKVAENLKVLKQETGYKTLIRNNPSILFDADSKELQEIVDGIKEKREKDKEEYKEKYENDSSEEASLTSDEEVEKDSESETEDDESDDEEGAAISYDNDEIGDADEQEITENGEIKLGGEDKVLHVLETLKEYGIPYNILIVCPEILKRKKLVEIDYILKLLKEKGIPMSVIEYCPEILERGKSKDIQKVIEAVETQGLPLTLFVVCPSILINSKPEKIRKVVEALNKQGISKYLVCSTPQILISGKIDILIEVANEMKKAAPDINIVLSAMEDKKESLIRREAVPYVFIESAYNYTNLLTASEYSETVNKKMIANRTELVVIKHVDESQKVIDVLKKEKISTDVVTTTPQLLNANAGNVEQVAQKAKEQGVEKKALEKNPQVLLNANANDIEEIVESLQANRPMSYKKIITTVPAVLFDSSKEKIESTVESCRAHKVDYTVIDRVPQLLTMPNSEEAFKVMDKLTGKGYKQEEIISKPEVLVQGNAKYVDRNIDTFERNGLNIPLHLAHVSPARNNEKNIDTLIEIGLYGYIEETPEILLLPNTKLKQYISIARKNNIPLVVGQPEVLVKESVELEKKPTQESTQESTQKPIIKSTVMPTQKRDRHLSKVPGTRINMAYFELTPQELSDIYGIDPKYIEMERKKAEKQDTALRKIPEACYGEYSAIYPIVEKQATVVLAQYAVGDIAYGKNNRVVSKQKVVRETTLDLLEIVETGGKPELKKQDTSKMLEDKVETLTESTRDKKTSRVVRKRASTYGATQRDTTKRQPVQSEKKQIKKVTVTKTVTSVDKTGRDK